MAGEHDPRLKARMHLASLIVIAGHVVDQDNSRAEAITAGHRAQEQSEIDHRERPCRENQAARPETAERAESNVSSTLGTSSMTRARVDRVTVWTGFEGQEQHG